MSEPDRFERISVIGLGYIGLPTAAMFASRRKQVIGVDVNTETVNTINQGQVHIVEPDLDIAVRACVREGYLKAVERPEPADAFLIAVPTPFTGDNQEPNFDYIEAASRAIAPVLVSGNLVILESTSPVGATERMAAILAEERPDLSFPETHGEASDVRIAHCPERVLPGKVMRELVTNDRVIGGLTHRCSQLAAELYRTFVTGECVIASGPRVAELAKLTENSFRDVNIAFANELSMISDRLDIDVWELVELANRHPRVNILQPGPGVGGHCIAVDPWFIVSSAPEQARLIRQAREVNTAKPEWVIAKVREAVGAHLLANPGKTSSDVVIGCYGLSFKPDIDDLRESPALNIAQSLHDEHNGALLLVEPHVQSLPPMLSGAELVDQESARQKADIHVMLVDHREFVNTSSPEGMVVDARGVWR